MHRCCIDRALACSLDPALIRKDAEPPDLLEFNAILDNTAQVFTVDENQRLFDAYLKHATLFARGGGRLRPKHHVMFHLAWQVKEKGNPRLFSTYLDESLNGVIAKIARSAHKSCWETMVHRRFAVLQQCGQNSWAQAH